MESRIDNLILHNLFKIRSAIETHNAGIFTFPIDKEIILLYKNLLQTTIYLFEESKEEIDSHQRVEIEFLLKQCVQDLKSILN